MRFLFIALGVIAGIVLAPYAIAGAVVLFFHMREILLWVLVLAIAGAVPAALSPYSPYSHH